MSVTNTGPIIKYANKGSPITPAVPPATLDILPMNKSAIPPKIKSVMMGDSPSFCFGATLGSALNSPLAASMSAWMPAVNPAS